MVFDAILMSRQTCEKLQGLYENLMSNSIRRTAVLKHNMDCKLQNHFWGFYWKKLKALHALEDLEPLFKIFYTFVCKKVPGKITDKYVENLKQASGEI